jgi:ribosomal protein S27AE
MNALSAKDILLHPQWGDDSDIKEALECAINALGKQIPKRPLEEKKFYGIGKCPSCGAVFLDKNTNYCGNCGQALDWSGANG